MSKLFRYIFFLTIIAIAIGYEVSAQVSNYRQGPVRRNLQPNKAGKKLEEARDRFLSQQLNLTEDEGVKFWPLYHQYQEELKAVRILKRLNRTSGSSKGTEQIDKELYYDNQMLTIKKRYLDEFQRILPSSKISELYKSESQFNDEVLKQLSERSIRAGN